MPYVVAYLLVSLFFGVVLVLLQQLTEFVKKMHVIAVNKVHWIAYFAPFHALLVRI